MNLWQTLQDWYHWPYWPVYAVGFVVGYIMLAEIRRRRKAAKPQLNEKPETVKAEK